MAIHGTHDEMVPVDFARDGFSKLREANLANVDFQTVPMCGHEFPISTAKLVGRFLHNAFEGDAASAAQSQTEPKL